METAAKDLLGKLNDVLAQYEKSLGLPGNIPDIQAEKYLNMPVQDMAKMNAEQCGEAGIVLAQFGFFLQKSFNVEIRTVNWATSMLRRTIGGETKQFIAPSREEREIMAIKGNEAALKLEQIRCQAQARADSINYLSSKVDTLSQRFSELQCTKRKQ